MLKMKHLKIMLLTLLLSVGLIVNGQIDHRNLLVRQIANGDTILSRIYNGYDTYDGSNPIFVNYYDSTAFVGSRGMGVTKFQSYGNATINGNSYLGNGTDSIFINNTDTIVGTSGLDSITGNIGNSTTSIDTLFAKAIALNSSYVYSASRSFTDDEAINLPADIGGELRLWSEDNDYGLFTFKIDGTIVLVVGNGNIAATDSDTDLCAFDGGTYITIRNRLGGTKKIMYAVTFTK